MSGTDIIMVFLGLLACFAGYSMFRSMLPLWGFILGGWVFYTLMPVFITGPQAGELVYQIGSFILGGVIGAVIAIPLYYVMIFISGGALGMLAGIMIGAIIDVGGVASMRQINALGNMTFPPTAESGTQFFLMIVFGLILGGVAISFQKFMICASSAFIGAGALVTGLGGTITQVSAFDTSRAVVMLLAWLLIGLLGLFVQFRMMGEV